MIGADDDCTKRSITKQESVVTLLGAAFKFLERTAIVAGENEFSYADLMASAAEFSKKLDRAILDGAQHDELDDIGPRVAIMAPASAEYVVATWATWMCDGVAVPLAVANPAAELEYVLQDAKVSAAIVTRDLEQVLAPICERCGVELLLIEPPSPGAASKEQLHSMSASEPGADRGALIIYTSGTTGQPKGVLHTHKGLAAQARSLSEAWRFHPEDRVLHVLPLHHIHGIVNAMFTPLCNGATVELQRTFNPAAIWRRLTASPPITVFMGVPTMYVLLMKKFSSFSEEHQAAARAAAGALRLTISGSAACPVPVMTEWQTITGQRLLERYGMTEIGMALSNPYAPMSAREPGCVGSALPGVEVKLAPAESDSDIQDFPDVQTGEICVRGPTLFKLYFGREQATAESFDEEGYFRTGDTGALSNGVYRILGRTSVDIIKSGGYKLSALEIENHLLENPAIKECAVCGVKDDTMGEAVAVVVVYNEGQEISDSDLRAWARQHMALYKVPKTVKVMDAIPRNAMGKVNKKQLVTVFAN